MKIIEPIIMDTDFKELGTIDDYISLIWTTRYYKNGDFELCLDVDNEYLDMIRKDYYIYREDDENVGIIQNITIELYFFIFLFIYFLMLFARSFLQLLSAVDIYCFSLNTLPPL